MGEFFKGWRRKIGVVTLMVACVFTAGWVRSRTVSDHVVFSTSIVPQDIRLLTAEESRIVNIARQTVATNDTWSESAEFDMPEKNSDGSWTVTVWRLPKTPGGHRTIVIDASGTVTNYHRGL